MILSRLTNECTKGILNPIFNYPSNPLNYRPIRPKKGVSANMPKKIRVGRSENLFIFLQIFIQ